MKRKLYTVLTGDDLGKLTSNIDEFLNDGWECVGGVAVAFDPAFNHVTLCHEVLFAQALTKDRGERE